MLPARRDWSFRHQLASDAQPVSARDDRSIPQYRALHRHLQPMNLVRISCRLLRPERRQQYTLFRPQSSGSRLHTPPPICPDWRQPEDVAADLLTGFPPASALWHLFASARSWDLGSQTCYCPILKTTRFPVLARSCRCSQGQQQVPPWARPLPGELAACQMELAERRPQISIERNGA